MGIGTVVWDNGQVTVEAIGLKGEPVVSAAHRFEDGTRMNAATRG
jgi:hypothetical protein